MSTDQSLMAGLSTPFSLPMQEFRLHGETMGTRYACTFFAPAWTNIPALKMALHQAVDNVDQQMSPWIPGSEINLINAAPLNSWLTLSPQIFQVIQSGLSIGRLSDGAFEIGVGALTNFYGFGPTPPGDCEDKPPEDLVPAFEALQIDEERFALAKSSPISLDLCGIAKGFGVDELARTLEARNVRDYLVAIDGDLRCSGSRADGGPWTIAIEAPAVGERSGAISLDVTDISIATSGSYRHQKEWSGELISHTMDGRSQAPLETNIVSTTVAAKTCMVADAWATAFMVAGLDNPKIETQDHDVLMFRSNNDCDDLSIEGSGVFASRELVNFGIDQRSH